MSLNKVIDDSYFNLETKIFKEPKIRIAARGIILNNLNQIAIFHKKNKNEYKLPGGGIDFKETPEEAFIREVLEETGLVVEITKKLGIIEEQKSQDNFIQKSYVFLSKVIKDTGQLSLTQKEKDEGGSYLWLSPEEGLKKISNCIKNLKESKYENLYHSKFIVARDKYILEYYIRSEKNGY